MSYHDAILARSPSAYWPLTETAGSIFADATGNGHDATIAAGAGVTVTPAGDDGAQSGQSALSLAVARAQADVHALTLGNPASLPFASGYTGGAWSVEWWSRDALGKSDGLSMRVSTVADLNLAWGLTQQSSFSVGVSAFVFHDAAFAEVVGGYDAAHPGCWHHWVITWTGTTLLLYRDGALVAWDTTNGDMNVFGAAGTFTPDTAFINLVGDAQYSLNHLAIYPVALDAAAAKANYWASWPRQDAACYGASGIPNPPPPPPDWLRLRHASGRSYIQQNGEQVQVVAGGAGVLDLPLPALAAAPARYVGIDAATGLPASAPLPPLPPTALSTYVTPVAPAPVPAGPTADTVRCGAAHQMATRLTRLYNIVRAAVGAALDVGGPLVASAIVDIALDILTEGTMGTWIAANGESYRFMKIVLGGAINAIEQGLLPPLDATATHGLVNAAYEALPAGQAPIAITQAALDQWATNIGNNGAAFLGAADTTLRLLVPTIPLDQWQQEINTGSQYPSSDCA